jgi:hypothetical protein
MKNLNRFAFLLLVTSSLSMFSQMKKGGFKLIDEEVVVSTNVKPEVLLNFDAIIDNDKVELTWASNTENNNNFFFVEKSKDAVNFEIVTTVKSFGNNSNIISYFEVDNSPYDGQGFYRLKQINERGVILSSRIISVNYQNNNSANFASNNSTKEKISNLLQFENKEVLVVLRDEKGIESFSKVYVDDNNNIEVTNENENKLNLGTYLVIGSSDNKLYSQRVVVK